MRDGTGNAVGEQPPAYNAPTPQTQRFALHNSVSRDRPSSVTPDGVPPPDLRCPAHAARPYGACIRSTAALLAVCLSLPLAAADRKPPSGGRPRFARGRDCGNG